MQTVLNLYVDNQTAALFDFYTKEKGKDISKMFEIFMLNLIHNELAGIKSPFKPLTLEEYNNLLEESEKRYFK